MSLYNMVRGMNLAAFLVLPVLDKHPEEYPRFRDAFVRKGLLVVLTRTGGNNREDFEKENQVIRKMEGFVKDYDDDFDNTFAYWEFKIPEKWKKDIDLVLAGKYDEVSAEYKAQFDKVWPKLSKESGFSPWENVLHPESVKEMVYGDNETPFDNWPGRNEMEEENNAN